MQASVAEIQDIEIQIRRIALNASIRAAQIGESGEALNTIADTMHQLVFESSQSTEAASTALKEMQQILAYLGAADGDSSAARLATETILTDFREAVNSLRDSLRSSASLVAAVGDTAGSLSAAIDVLLGGFECGTMMSDVARRVRHDLDRMSKQAADSSSNAAHHGTAIPYVDEYARRYTMHSERAVHDAVLGGALTENTAPAPTDAAEANVEFF